ncbi:hypothetical protein CLI64_17395 [Nostoc sp. CENA543]|uniref:glycosyltransferase family 39 protein n=1 Tax=Nostoc sp. CENA543 TaxID=1869241 RepID=UPI000CA0BCE9|nr:glycosyltransferase family 39 protein [Nostoc sp. CENA543]AUT02016.1 hypothetical protein CLI64_17395 [Nostoc sp. CENA543]
MTYLNLPKFSFSIFNQSIFSRILCFLISILLVLGIFFRCSNIADKVYWTDETFTSLQLSGYLQSEVSEQLLDGREIDVNDIKKYQYPELNSHKNISDTIKGIISFEPQHTPLYFIIARYWVQCFGDSVTAIRSLSVLASILALPMMYWLCLEIFQNIYIAYFSVAFLAVSPFHILYSQEARPFSFWITVILFSSAALLQAQRSNTARSWIIYSLSVSIGLWSFLLSILVYAAHTFYILVSERFRWNRKIIAYLISLSFGCLTFVPWIVVLIIHRDRARNYALVPAAYLTLIKAWIRNISLFFADFSLNDSSPQIYLVVFTLVLLIVIVLVTYSIYFLVRNYQQQNNLFVLSLLLVPAVITIFADFLFKSQFSSSARYLIPTYLGMQIAVIYMLFQKIAGHQPAKFPSQKQWYFLTVLLISISVSSCVTLVNSHQWWLKGTDNYHHQIAKIINSSSEPLVVSDDFFIRIFSLSHELRKDVKLQLMVEPDKEPDKWRIPQISEQYRNVFVYNPSEKMKNSLQEQGNLISVYSVFDKYGSKAQRQQKVLLWKFIKKSPELIPTRGK